MTYFKGQMTTDHTFVATVVGIILLGTPLEFRHGDLDNQSRTGYSYNLTRGEKRSPLVTRNTYF